MRNLALLTAHVEALYSVLPIRRLFQSNEPNAPPAPRFFLGQTPDGKAWWLRHDLPAAITEAIARELATAPDAMDTDGPGTAMPGIERILSEQKLIERTWLGAAFRFPATVPPSTAIRVSSSNVAVLKDLMSAWLGDTEICAPLMAVIVEGRAVSVCGSVRRSAVAHEAGVETAASFRGKGHGVQAVTAWAAAVTTMGRIPLYSAAWANTASRALARRLGLIQFASDFHLT